MEITESELFGLLIDCLKKDGPAVDVTARLSGLSPENWHAFLSLAEIQRVRPLLWHRLKTKHLTHLAPEASMAALERAYRETTLRNLRFYGELHRLTAAMDEENIPLIVLKGMALAEAVYGNIGHREMNDIDLLAHPQHLSRITEQLSTFGYKPQKPFSNDAFRQILHHLPRMMKADKAGFEIHWNLTCPGEFYTIDPVELWQRAALLKLKNGGHLLTLCPEDMLLHICFHTSYHHQFAFGLRPFCDIAEILVRFGRDISWTSVLDRAERWKWRRGVYLALRLAKDLVNADIPDEIIKSMRPPDFDEGIKGLAQSQVFTDARFAATISEPFAQLFGKKSHWEKIRIFWDRLFLDRKLMATVYPAAPDSFKIYCYYPVWVFRLICRYGRTMYGAKNSYSEICGITERKRKINRFLLEQ